MLLKGCLHTHTKCSDGELTPQQAADEYRKRGYDFIAFTDHDYLLTPDYRDQYTSVKGDILIFTGIELTVFMKGYVHVNKIEGDRDTLHILNHIGEYDLTGSQIIERIKAVAEIYPLDAVEITTKGFRQPELEKIKFSCPAIASDDAHTLLGIGRAWIEMDAKKDRDSIIRTIRNGDFWNCFV